MVPSKRNAILSTNEAGMLHEETIDRNDGGGAHPVGTGLLIVDA
jgi:hypothetical protein